MPFLIRRPKGLKRPRAGLIDRDSLRASKSSTIRFVPFGGKYPGVEPKASRNGAVDAEFKAEVEALLGENAELLRRLAK
ncbi:MAG TPA: hypothetical protein VGH33_24975 [Isosphaeraceae bacterium]|jgi:hypothetical protein